MGKSILIQKSAHSLIHHDTCFHLPFSQINHKKVGLLTITEAIMNTRNCYIFARVNSDAFLKHSVLCNASVAPLINLKFKQYTEWYYFLIG